MTVDYKKLIQSPQFLFEVAKGNVEGHTYFHKFANNPDIDAADTEDIWGYGGTYTYITTNSTLYLSSSSAADTQVILVQGLDANFRLQEQLVTLTGQTAVEIGTGLKWSRIYRMINQGSTNIAGMVYCHETDTLTGGVPDTVTKVKGTINDGKNQTLMSQYCIPANHCGFLLQGYAVLSSRISAYATIDFKTRPFGGVFQTKEFIAVANTHNFVLNYPVPLMVSPKTDLKVIGTSSANNVSVSAGYDLLLVREDNLLL